MIFKNIFFSKHSYLAILITVCVSCVSKNQTEEGFVTDELTNMTFKKEIYNFGEIPMGKSVSTLFRFLNTGKNPLLVKDVTTSCGCTVPEWSKGIIKPNESGEIKIVYDAKYPGYFNKTIMVVYNGKNSPQQLIIEGKVPYPKKDKKTRFNIAK